MYKFLLVSCIVSLLFLPLIGLSAKPLNVVINEIAWMGTKQSYNNEWLELYNNTNRDLNLEGWKIISKNKKLSITLKGAIPKKGFFILERGDDSTIPDIKANLLYKGALSNKGEDLILLGNKGEIIDEVNCLPGWFAGNNNTKQTMERKDPSKEGNNPQNWQSSKLPGGTPRFKNSVLEIIPETKNKKQVLLKYPSNIFISEIMPSPKGPDSQNEWIEITNQNNFEVNLGGWQISDTKGKANTYILPKNTIIEKKGFLVLSRTATKITLNNSGDEIILSQPDKKKTDQVSYTNAPCGQSFAKIKNKWQWTSIPTPGKPNQSSLPTANQTIEQNKNKENYLSAKISPNEVSKGISKLNSRIFYPLSSFYFILFLALIFAFSCGVVFLCLKNHFKI